MPIKNKRKSGTMGTAIIPMSGKERTSDDLVVEVKAQIPVRFVDKGEKAIREYIESYMDPADIRYISIGYIGKIPNVIVGVLMKKRETQKDESHPILQVET